MATKTCPNGHRYDPNIYGDQCPLCPAQEGMGAPTPSTQIGGGGSFQPDLHTHIAGAQQPSSPMGGAAHTQVAHTQGAQRFAPQPPVQQRMPRPSVQPAAGQPANRTVIRHATPQGVGGQPQGLTRKLVGFLITYNRDPNGKAYNIYEGRNYIGRDPSCDICVPEDDQMSGRHLSILYRNVDDKFKFRDEQSSNGTFVNKELIDSGELENYDIIRAGSTIFIFLAIPRIS